MYDYLETSPGERPTPNTAWQGYELNISSLESIFSDCADFERRDIYFGLDKKACVNLCWIDGLTDGGSISGDIIRPLTDLLRSSRSDFPGGCLGMVMHGLAYSANAKRRGSIGDVVSDLAHGYCAVLIPGEGAVCFEVKSQNARSISEPSLEKSVKGGKDSFVETLRTNTALVRRRIRDPRLKSVKTELGRKSHTQIEVMYLDGVVDPELPMEVLRRLGKIDIDSVLATGIIEESLMDCPRSPLPQLIHTERPDRFAMYMADGRVGILIDGIPIALVVPASFAEFMKVTSDSSMHFTFSSMLSVMRYLALIVSVYVPAVYVAVAMYHQEMIPTRLLLSIISAKQDVPFSTGLEVIGMLVALELLQEAGLRLPNPIGDTVSIIGALIVGQSEVEAKVASPIAIIVGHRVLHTAKSGSRRGGAADTLRASHRRGRGGAVRHWAAVVPDAAIHGRHGQLRPQLHLPRHRRAASRHTADAAAHSENRRQIPRRRASPARQEETVLKRAMIYLLCLAALPWLGGCNSIYSNYREIENLLVVRSVGFDREDGGTRFSLASSANDDGEPIRMTTKGGSITDAMERIRNYSSQEDIFYPHVEHILLGEDAARVSIEDYLAFFCRSPELRIDIPLHIVRGGTAAQAVLETGSDSRCISEILQTEQERLSVSGDSNIFSTSEIYVSMVRSGAALVCAVKCAPSAEAAEDDAQILTVIADGYAIIKDGRLCGYIEPELSPAVGMLTGDMGISDLIVDGPDGDAVTLQLNHCRSGITPRWDGDMLTGFDIDIEVSASVNESGRPLPLSDPEQERVLCEALNARVTELVNGVLRTSQELGADFLNLNYTAELDSPKKYAALGGGFITLFPKLEMNVSVSSRISHTNNISNG